MKASTFADAQSKAEAAVRKDVVDHVVWRHDDGRYAVHPIGVVGGGAPVFITGKHALDDAYSSVSRSVVWGRA